MSSVSCNAGLLSLAPFPDSSVMTVSQPIRFLRSGDRIDRRLTGSMTVLTVRVFCSWAKFSYGQAHRRDRSNRPSWPHLAARTVCTVSCYGFYGQLLRSLRHLRSVATVSPTHSFTLGLNPSFSANFPYRCFSFFSFRIHYMDFPDCLLLLLSISVFFTF